MKREEGVLFKLLQKRTPPAILILDESKAPLYFNQVALDILRSLNGSLPQASFERDAIHIPVEISNLCDKLKQRFKSSDSDNNESLPYMVNLISTPAGSFCCRGFFLNSHNGNSKSHERFHIIVLIEKVSKHRKADFDEFRKRFCLTERQIDIVKRLVIGETNKQIANALCICEDTVKCHLKNIMEHLEVSTRTEVISMLYSI